MLNFACMEEYLKETSFLITSHPSVAAFCAEISSAKSKREIAVSLYFKVRDHFLYDPFHLDLRAEALKVNVILQKKRAWCSEKAIVMATCARYFGIPSRLGYSIVINHLGAEKLEEFLGRKEIVFHGYVELFIEGKWIKCTPAFDQRICRISHVEPLDWDGIHDSLFQEFEHGKRYMEYLHDYGTFSDVPIDLMNAEMQKYYPQLFEDSNDTKGTQNAKKNMRIFGEIKPNR